MWPTESMTAWASDGWWHGRGTAGTGSGLCTCAARTARQITNPSTSTSSAAHFAECFGPLLHAMQCNAGPPFGLLARAIAAVRLGYPTNPMRSAACVSALVCSVQKEYYLFQSAPNRM